MAHPLVCMTLTGKTLQENLNLVKKYEKHIDLVELRVDCLNEEEQLYIKRFPSLVYQPCILSIRRDIDGGFFTGGEFARTNLFGRALAFANPDRSKNFAYVDFEEDFQIPSIQDAAMAFGVKIIRSYHCLDGNLPNIRQKSDSLRKTGYEIPKIAFLPSNLANVASMFKDSEDFIKYDHIFTATGVHGLPSRILAHLTNSYLTYVKPQEFLTDSNREKHIDPITLDELYNFRNLSRYTEIFGVAGWPMKKTTTIEILNKGMFGKYLDSISVPLRSPHISDVLTFSEQLGFSGLSINEPFNEKIMYYLSEQSDYVTQTGFCNTVIRKNNKWLGYNTDIFGFKKALEEFLGETKIKRKKVALLGAGGSARIAAYVLHQMGAKVCIFNRTIENAQNIAEKYGFKYSSMEVTDSKLLEEYSYLIVQTTCVGSDLMDTNSKENDPIPFYKFHGNERVFDIVYSPAVTPLLQRASMAGCTTSNGQKMLEYKTQEQFKLLTGYRYN